MSEHTYNRRERADHRAAKRYAPPPAGDHRPHDPRKDGTR